MGWVSVKATLASEWDSSGKSMESCLFNFLRRLWFPGSSRVLRLFNIGCKLINGWCGFRSLAPSLSSSAFSSSVRSIPQTFIFSVRLRISYHMTVLTISLLEAYTIGTIVTFYDTVVVLEALLITLGLFAGLTLFTMQSKWDFSGMGPFLFGGLWALILAGFVMLFFPHNG